MTHSKNNTFTLRLRQSKAILIALAQGSLPWAALSVAGACALLIAGRFIFTSEYAPEASREMMIDLYQPLIFSIGCVSVLISLIFSHSALDELRPNFPQYELLFPVPTGVTVSIHLLYKAIIWIVLYIILDWTKVVARFWDFRWSYYFYIGDANFRILEALLVFLCIQQIAWVKSKVYRIFWVGVHSAFFSFWYIFRNYELMYVQIIYLIVLCYVQVYLQRRGGFSFDIVDTLSRINLGSDTERKLSPLRAMVEVQWKAWYRWIFIFTVVVCIPPLLTGGMDLAIAAAGMLYLLLGYVFERRDSSAYFYCLRPVHDKLLVRARHLNALRCAVQTLLVFVCISSVVKWLAHVGGYPLMDMVPTHIDPFSIYEKFINTEAKAAIVFLYVGIYLLIILGFYFALVAGRFLILLTVFMACVLIVVSGVFFPLADFIKSYENSAILLTGIVFLQCLLTYLSLKERDLFVLRRYIQRDWIARLISSILVTSLGFEALLTYTFNSRVAILSAVIMLALLAAKQVGTLEKRDYGLLTLAALVGVLAPLPVVLSFTDNLAQDWVAWGTVVFCGLALPMLCVPMTVRWQRVLG